MTWEEFCQYFNTEEACADALYQFKWPNGFSCARCGHHLASTIVTRRLPLYECRHCHYQSSLTSGTIMEGSRTHLRKWFMAFFLISQTESGTNAVELSRVIGVTYKTAWLILRKIRHVISEADGRSLLSGIVRVNGSVYGRPHNPSWYHHPQEHPLLIGASMDEQGEPICIKMKLVSEEYRRERLILRSAEQNFIEQHIEPRTKDVQTVTSRWSHKRFQRLLRVSAAASKWINSTFHGLGSKHLQAYLDEFCYRLNLSLQRTPIFHHLTHLCAKSEKVTYSMLKGTVTR
ncbi:hypothetical protein PN4B1_33170 [Paenibacillus naphthalenovorans]|uniref:transposase n=1 Tax=Paenibacillus naphthalenovorans TaxID=162209 RepID=UPI0010B0E31E|nr:transposase [Paenibacillus naphthalenovorans]GCL73380.1 hypothetical protein PN4B1_33170 [Paenibacillus naphthalenovorans]